ncbi:MAG: NosD domain-containing protein [Zestosphaera sp.]
MDMRYVLLLTLAILVLTSVTAPATIPENIVGKPRISSQSSNLLSYVPPNETECDIIVPDNYPSINMSVTVAQPGQTICVRPGTYTEVNGTIINKNGLRLLALGRPEVPDESVVIKKSGFLLRIQANDVVVKGFIIIQEGNWHGIDVYDGSQNVTIAYNIVTTTNPSITGYYGIRVYRSSNVTVAYNKIHGWINSYGIFINEASNNTIASNTIVNNGNGIRIRGTTNPARYNRIFLNTIVNNTYGIYLSITSGGILSDNMIYLNTFSNANNYDIYGTPGTNRWYSPDKYAFAYEDRYFTSYMGNYWSNYNGSDLDNNGIGDAPYVIDSNNIDEYPLMKPHQEYLLGAETPTPTETTTETTTETPTETTTETETPPPQITVTVTETQPITITTTITTTMTQTETYTYTTITPAPIQTQTVTLPPETETKTVTSVLTYKTTEREATTVKVTETSPVETLVVDYTATAVAGIMLLLVGFLIGFVLKRK